MYDSIRLMVGGLGLLSREMVMRNYVAYEHGDCQALEALVAHYGYLAFEKAFRLFHRLGDEARDLAQELLCEVVEVLKKPLPSGSKNLTFWMNVALDRKVREHLTQDAVGTYRENRLLKKLVAVRLELESLGRAPTHPELAQALGVDEVTLERLLYLEEANRILSLSSPHPQTGTRLEDMVVLEEDVVDELEEALEKARLGLKGEELSTLERFWRARGRSGRPGHPGSENRCSDCRIAGKPFDLPRIVLVFGGFFFVLVDGAALTEAEVFPVNVREDGAGTHPFEQVENSWGGSALDFEAVAVHADLGRFIHALGQVAQKVGQILGVFDINEAYSGSFVDCSGHIVILTQNDRGGPVTCGTEGKRFPFRTSWYSKGVEAVKN